MPYPSRCTSENRAALIAAKRSGMSDRESAQRAGISVRALYQWQDFGRAGISPYAELMADLTAAFHAHRADHRAQRAVLPEAA